MAKENKYFEIWKHTHDRQRKNRNELNQLIMNEQTYKMRNFIWNTLMVDFSIPVFFQLRENIRDKTDNYFSKNGNLW